MIIPICKWYPIDDGYGIVGYGWVCTECETSHPFVVPFIADTYVCKECNKYHLCNFEE